MNAVQITVPLHARPGEAITVPINGQNMTITLPPQAVPGGPLVVQVPIMVTPMPVAHGTQVMAPVAPIAPVAPQPSAQGAMRQPLLGAEDVHVPMGKAVHEAMPILPPAGEDAYTGFQYATEQPGEAGRHHAAEGHGHYADATASSAVPMGQPVFYSDAELEALKQAPLPADAFVAAATAQGVPVGQPLDGAVHAGQYYPIAQSAASAVQAPILTTAAGVPVVATAQQVSAARTSFDGWSGIKSCDPVLQRDADELMLFFATHNSRPLLGCKVHGWHHETRHRTRTVRDSQGRTRTTRETYVVKGASARLDPSTSGSPPPSLACLSPPLLTQCSVDRHPPPQ